jgi:hypothetical protein
VLPYITKPNPSRFETKSSDEKFRSSSPAFHNNYTTRATGASRNENAKSDNRLQRSKPNASQGCARSTSSVNRIIFSISITFLLQVSAPVPRATYMDELSLFFRFNQRERSELKVAGSLRHLLPGGGRDYVNYKPAALAGYPWRGSLSLWMPFFVLHSPAAAEEPTDRYNERISYYLHTFTE